jgi:hypothetical protein
VTRGTPGYNRLVLAIHRRPSGFGLPSILLISVILALLLTTLIGANSSTLAVTRHSEGASIARAAAESALARGIFEVRDQESFGLLGESLHFQPDIEASGTAVVTFDTVEASRLEMPVSVNNLASDESKPGVNGEVIPARTARLFAKGSFGSESRTVALDLHIPPFPHAVATDGTFLSLGDLTLSGVSPESGEQIPGHLVANSGSTTSISLGSRTEISGDVISAGGVILGGDDIVVKGEVKNFEQPTAVPKIDLRDFDPRAIEAGGDHTTANTSFYRDTTFEGKVLREGDLYLGGTTELNGALLYVDGNLQISGDIRGRGAIVCTGNVVVDGIQNLAADNEMAILVGGSLSLQGRGVQSSRLEGLIYCEGDVTVRDSTIQGTLISHSNGSTIPSVIMERAALVYDPSQTELSVGIEGASNEADYTLEFDGVNSDYVKQDERGKRQSEGKPVFYVGVKILPGGAYRFFPPFGGPPVDLANLGNVNKQMEEFFKPRLGNGIQMNNADYLRTDLKKVQEGKLGGYSGGGGTEGQSFELEIDPMRFLKYGERIKIRSIRVLDSGGDRVG